jgi:hypothetical protein
MMILTAAFGRTRVNNARPLCTCPAQTAKTLGVSPDQRDGTFVALILLGLAVRLLMRRATAVHSSVGDPSLVIGLSFGTRLR